MGLKTQNRYRIYTEDKNVDGLLDLFNQYFDGFTVYRGSGYWHGEHELCLVFEIIANVIRNDDIEKICEQINKMNSQDCCLVTIEQVQTILI